MRASWRWRGGINSAERKQLNGRFAVVSEAIQGAAPPVRKPAARQGLARGIGRNRLERGRRRRKRPAGPALRKGRRRPQSGRAAKALPRAQRPAPRGAGRAPCWC